MKPQLDTIDFRIKREPDEPNPEDILAWRNWYLVRYGRGNLKAWNSEDMKFVESQRIGTLQRGYRE